VKMNKAKLVVQTFAHPRRKPGRNHPLSRIQDKKGTAIQNGSVTGALYRTEIVEHHRPLICLFKGKNEGIVPAFLDQALVVLARFNRNRSLQVFGCAHGQRIDMKSAHMSTRMRIGKYVDTPGWRQAG